MQEKTSTEVYEVIARVTGKMPCGPCGRAGIDPQIRAAAASA